MKTKIISILCIAASLVTSCEVNETLCEAEHPHKGWVQFHYNWDKMPAYYQQYLNKGLNYLDSMFIIGDRVINQRISYFGYSTLNDDGCYKSDLFREWTEQGENGETLYHTEKTGDGRTNIYHIIEKINENGERVLVEQTYEKNEHQKKFFLPSGEYKFLTVNMDTKDYKYTGLSSVDIENSNVHLGDVVLENVTYEGNSAEVAHPEEWTDNNTTFDKNVYTYEGTPAGFIRSSNEPVTVDSTAIMKWNADEVKTIEFHPIPVTQNIDVFFDLKKTAEVEFKVDSVWCIMSGVPHSTNVGTGALNVSSTDKIMFRTYFVDPNSVPTYDSQHLTDEIGNTNLRCYANITVPGIVENTVTDANTYIGPGVMQLIIWTNITDPTRTGPKPVKILVGMVNLHKSLTAAKLQTFDTDLMVWKKSRDHTSLYLSFDGSITYDMLYGSEVGGIVPFEEKEVPEEFVIY
ncbi:MAG: hypothetical protein IKO28_02880 [Prevotella sp.]|nr:hypothetical protein [Prevotella sp.]MBR4651692.1 hypothetical protein [Prevotella sp.]